MTRVVLMFAAPALLLGCSQQQQLPVKQEPAQVSVLVVACVELKPQPWCRIASCLSDAALQTLAIPVRRDVRREPIS